MSIDVLLLGIVLWFGLGALISSYARMKSRQGVSDYFLASRSVGGFISAMTYSATTYSAFMMVGLVGLTYKSGIASLGFELTYLLGTVLLLTLFAPRYWVIGKLLDLVTPSELLSRRYENRWVGATSSILCLVMLIPYASVQLMGMGYLMEILTAKAMPFTVGACIAGVVSLAFCLWAGLRSVAWTDALQATIMIIASTLLLVFVLLGASFHFPSMVLASSHLLRVNWPFPLFIGLTLPWTFFALTNPQVVQRLYSPKDVRSIRRMIVGFAFFGFFYTILCVSLGLIAAVSLPGLENPDNAMPLLLTKVPWPLALIVVLSIMAAAVSTFSAILLTLGSMFGRDFLKILKPDLSEHVELAFSKGLLPLLTLICLAFAWFRPGLIAVLSAMASGGLLMQVPSVFGAFFWKRASASASLTSMIGGACVMIALYATDLKPLGQWPCIWGFLASIFLFVLVSLMTSPPSNAESFLLSLQTEMRRRFNEGKTAEAQEVKS